MNRIISERAFEDAIVCALLGHGPDECPGDELSCGSRYTAFMRERVRFVRVGDRIAVGGRVVVNASHGSSRQTDQRCGERRQGLLAGW